MRICLILLLSMCLNFAVFGQQVDISKLSAEKQTEIQKLVNEQAQQPVITPENVKKWVEVGQGIGAAIGATAKEMNVEVNSFANSPVGKFCIFLIAWKFFGEYFVTLTIFLMLLWYSLYRIYKTLRKQPDITYVTVDYLFGLVKLRKKESITYPEKKPALTESEITLALCHIVLGIISIFGVVFSVN